MLDGSVLTRIEPRIATQYASAPEYARPFFQYVADVTVQKITMTAIAQTGVSQIHPRSAQGRRDALSTTPSTQPRSVVCSEVNPNPATMSWRWLLSCASICQDRPSARHMSGRHTEFVTFLVSGMYSAGCKYSTMGEEVTHEMAAKKKNSHVFGSFRHSMNLRKVSRRQRRAARVIHSTTHWSFLKCLFSTPAWFTLMRSIAMTRSSGVRNHAVAGESGKKNLARDK